MLSPSSSYGQLPLPLSNSSGSNRGSLREDVTLQTMQAEVNTLVSSMSALQTEKWKMEEKLNILADKNAELQIEVEKKETIIRNYISNIKVEGRSTPEMEANKQEIKSKGGLMANLFKPGNKSNLPPDVAHKMAYVLEETLLKNIQLQNDLSTLGSEIGKLMEENKALKSQVADKLQPSTTSNGTT